MFAKLQFLFFFLITEGFKEAVGSKAKKKKKKGG